MKPIIGGVTLAVAIFLSLALQEFIPPVHALYDARVLLVPMLFCYGALSLPIWVVLPLAVYTGFLTDLTYLQVVSGQVEIALGWSIVFFVIFGVVSQGFQPSFLRGGWWVHLALAAGGTSVFLLLQYVMICIRRQGIIINEAVVWKIIGPGLFAAALSPLLHLGVVWAQNFLPEGMLHRRNFSTSRSR